MPYNLTPDEVYYTDSVKVNKYLLKDHNVNSIPLPQGTMDEIIGVTIHNTDPVPGDNDAESYTAATLDGDLKDVRVHFYVDENEAWQNLDTNSTGWHATDGTGDGNTKTIAIETIMGSSSDPQSLKARDNAARLAASLLYENGLDENNLYTHTYWLNVRDGIEGSRDYLNTLPNPYKVCPVYILPDWFEFKALVGKYIDELQSGEETLYFEPYRIRVTADTLNVRSEPGTKNPVTAKINWGDVYTITDSREADGAQWGKLNSSAGWVNLDFTDKV